MLQEKAGLITKCLEVISALPATGETLSLAATGGVRGDSPRANRGNRSRQDSGDHGSSGECEFEL